MGVGTVTEKAGGLVLGYWRGLVCRSAAVSSYRPPPRRSRAKCAPTAATAGARGLRSDHKSSGGLLLQARVRSQLAEYGTCREDGGEQHRQACKRRREAPLPDPPRLAYLRDRLTMAGTNPDARWGWRSGMARRPPLFAAHAPPMTVAAHAYPMYRCTLATSAALVHGEGVERHRLACGARPMCHRRDSTGSWAPSLARARAGGGGRGPLGRAVEGCVQGLYLSCLPRPRRRPTLSYRAAQLGPSDVPYERTGWPTVAGLAARRRSCRRPAAYLPLRARMRRRNGAASVRAKGGVPN